METHIRQRCAGRHDYRRLGVKNPALAAGLDGWRTFYEIAPGFIACGVTAVLVSLLGKAPDAAVQARFAQADADFRAQR